MCVCACRLAGLVSCGTFSLGGSQFNVIRLQQQGKELITDSMIAQPFMLDQTLSSKYSKMKTLWVIIKTVSYLHVAFI